MAPLVIAVATGAFSEGQLSSAGADIVLPDLRVTDDFVKCVIGSRSIKRASWH